MKQSELGYLITSGKLTSRSVRELIKCSLKDSIYDYNGDTMDKPKIKDIDEKTQRTFDKSIIILRTAMNKLTTVIEDVQENWILYEILMHHRSLIHNQIDLLIKEKKKV